MCGKHRNQVTASGGFLCWRKLHFARYCLRSTTSWASLAVFICLKVISILHESRKLPWPNVNLIYYNRATILFLCYFSGDWTSFQYCRNINGIRWGHQKAPTHWQAHTHTHLPATRIDMGWKHPREKELWVICLTAVRFSPSLSTLHHVVWPCFKMLHSDSPSLSKKVTLTAHNCTN